MLCKSCDELSDLPNFSSNKYKYSEKKDICQDCGKQLTWDDYLYHIGKASNIVKWKWIFKENEKDCGIQYD